MDFIKIPTQFRDYLELLYYEKVRYNDFLASVKREATNMTDEEWNSSWEYFSNLRDEAYIAFEIAINSMKEIYQEQLKNRKWLLNFPKSKIFLDDYQDDTYDEKESEDYNEQLPRLYPNEDKKTIKTVTLQVTDFCNMACTYCYQRNKKHNSMPIEKAKCFIDLLLNDDQKINSYFSINDLLGIIIDFIGGDPWLEIELVDEVSDYFIAELFRRKHPLAIRFMFNICSNGLLHFDPKVQNYLHKHAEHICYNITIDGNKELHDSCRIDLNGNGTYDRAIAGLIDYETTWNRKMGSKLTLSPNNINYLNLAAQNMINLGYKRINLNCVFEEGWENHHATELYNQLKTLTDWLFENNLEDKAAFSIFTRKIGKSLSEEENGNWCGGTGSMLAMDYKGDLYPCLRYMESSVGEDYPIYTIGNLEDGINCLPEHKERVNCLTCITRRSQSTDECWNCPIAEGCAWCSGYNYECFGTANKRATYICCMHKARVLANVYYWRRRGEEFPLNVPKEWALEIISEEEYEKLKNM